MMIGFLSGFGGCILVHKEGLSLTKDLTPQRREGKVQPRIFSLHHRPALGCWPGSSQSQVVVFLDLGVSEDRGP